jgi:Ca2+-binding EF-hand superfamily protein
MRWTLALSSLLVAVAAQAGDPQTAGKPGRHQVDANSDGIVTREEASSFPRLTADFDAVDANKDGQLDAAELNAHREKMRSEMRANAEARWKAADTDGNGSLSRAEADASMPRLAEDFDKLDANRDGAVSRDEMHGFRMQGAKHMRREAAERFKAADQDGDGALDLAEAQTGMPGLAERFSAVDANADGKVSAQELKSATHRL